MADRNWTIVYWLLTAAFLLTAAPSLLDARAGFLTSHLADLTVPAWLYVISRGLAPVARSSRIAPMRWIGRTPERAAVFFFLASAATEVSQVFWPRGFFAGQYDPWDIVWYAVGLSMCYVADKRHTTRGVAG